MRFVHYSWSYDDPGRPFCRTRKTDATKTTHEWREVTCARCLRKRETPLPLTKAILLGERLQKQLRQGNLHLAEKTRVALGRLIEDAQEAS
jgi:hypothetical protein